MNQAIKYITSLKEYAEFENVLRDEIANLLDVTTIDYEKGETSISRQKCAETLIKTLRRIKLLSNENIRVKPERYI